MSHNIIINVEESSGVEWPWTGLYVSQATPGFVVMEKCRATDRARATEILRAHPADDFILVAVLFGDQDLKILNVGE